MIESPSISSSHVLGAAMLGVAAAASVAGAETVAPANSLTPLLEVMRAHDAALAAQDLKGVLATLTDDVFLLGNGPTEVSKGQAEATEAYTRIFSNIAKASMTSTPVFYDGSIADNAGWLLAVTKVTASKDGKTVERGLNVSVALVKRDGQWKIRMMHFSSLPKAKAD